MKTTILAIAGVVLAISLAYLSVILSYMPVYPLHDKLRDVENGIELGSADHVPLFYPIQTSSSAMSYLGTYYNATNTLVNTYCQSSFSVRPLSFDTTSNGTINLVITIQGDSIVHLNGDNRFYTVEGLEENITPTSTTVSVVLKLNNVPEGILLIPVWDRCGVTYVNVSVF